MILKRMIHWDLEAVFMKPLKHHLYPLNSLLCLEFLFILIIDHNYRNLFAQNSLCATTKTEQKIIHDSFCSLIYKHLSELLITRLLWVVVQRNICKIIHIGPWTFWKYFGGWELVEGRCQVAGNGERRIFRGVGGRKGVKKEFLSWPEAWGFIFSLPLLPLIISTCLGTNVSDHDFMKPGCLT